MPKMAFKSKKEWRQQDLAMIQQANTIIAEYQTQGLDLTLRQLYYQFVSRDLFPATWADPKTGSTNNDRSYDKLGKIIADGRMCGLIDWEAIVDRTRYIRELSCWNTPQEMVSACSRQFRLDKWDRQPEYVECWVEKDALLGVLKGVCDANSVPYMSCRGYASISEVWKAGYERIKPKVEDGKKVTILYLGDHDPSGIDMTRDLQERLLLFTSASQDEVFVDRLALNKDQVDLYEPPPNPAKMTDSRASHYLHVHGSQCWELDALDPVVIRDLIQSAIEQHRDDDLWEKAIGEEDKHKKNLKAIAENWDYVVSQLGKKKGK